MENKIYSIQFLRAIAALLVLQLHLIPQIPFTDILFFGAIGVDIFFVISGYIIAASITKTKRTNNSGMFLINRFSRVVPYYWLLTICGFLLVLIFSRDHNLDGVRLLKSLLFIPQTDPTLPMGWTLNNEMFFYISIGIFSAFIHKDKLYWSGILFLLMLIICQIITIENYSVYFLKSSINYTFLLGFFTYFVFDKIKIYFEKKIMLLSSIILMIIVMTMTVDYPVFLQQKSIVLGNYSRDVIFLNLGNLDFHLPRFIFWGLPSFFLFLTFLSNEKLFNMRFRNSIFIKIGDASYSLYLIQFFIVLVVLHFNSNVLLIHLLGFILAIVLSFPMLKIENKLSKSSKNILLSIFKIKK